MIFKQKFKRRHTTEKHHLTRTRVFNFERLVVFQMNNATRTLAVEVNKFLYSITEEQQAVYTKQSYSQARRKLRHTAHIELNQAFCDSFYAEDDYKRYKGLRLIAVDGSKYRLPQTRELKEHFGYAENYTDKKVPMALSTVAYDLLNEIAINAELDRYTDYEASLFFRHIEKIRPARFSKDVYVLDRHYGSIHVITQMISLKKDFVIRTNPLLSEIREFAEDENSTDQVITIDIEKKHAQDPGMRLGEFIEKGMKTVSFRVVKLTLSSGAVEYLVTSLKKKDISRTELKKIYGLRWNEEGYFNYLKNTLEIENFSGKSVENVKQDYYSRILASNIGRLIMTEAQEEIDEELQEKRKRRTPPKYSRYKVNKAVIAGMIKDEIPKMLLLEDEKKWDKLYERLVLIAKKNKIPVIENRSFQRKSKKVRPVYLYRRKAL